MDIFSLIQNIKKNFIPSNSNLEQATFVPGETYYLATDSLTSDFSVIFEDDGDTGYFYAVLRHGSRPETLDAMLIYSPEDKSLLGKKTRLSIQWSKDNMKALLSLDSFPHAVFDFESNRGYCRKNFPSSNKKWTNHQWDDQILKFFNK